MTPGKETIKTKLSTQLKRKRKEQQKKKDPTPNPEGRRNTRGNEQKCYVLEGKLEKN